MKLRDASRHMLVAAAALMVAAGVASADTHGDDQGAFEEILGIMQQSNMVDEDGAARIRAKYAAEQDARNAKLPRLYLSGDLRNRYEGFWYDEDGLGNERSNRHRGRYRIRISGKAQVNEYISLNFRVSSGDPDFENRRRSANESFDDQFDRDDIYWDRAYADIRLPWFQGESWSSAIQIGKTPNPFISRVGRDFLVFDNDLNPEGVVAKLGFDPFDGTHLYFNTAMFIIEENSSSKDPKLTGIQGGFVSEVADGIELGARVSGYFYSAMDSDGGIGTATNLLGNVYTADTDSINIVEVRGHIGLDLIDQWPVLVYGSWAENTNADGIGAADGEDTAYGAGIEIGDEKEWVKLGFGWFSIEANALPDLFVDSDLFDGRTNREGFLVYAERQLFKNTDLALTIFNGKEIRDDPVFLTSIVNSDRTRMQLDLNYKFK